MHVKCNLTEEVYNKIFVTSDTHFGHDKDFLYMPRGYNNPQEMNEDMIKTINDCVGEDGILLHLGDFCLNTSLEDYQNILRKLKIKEIWMIWGNHNNPIQKSYGGSSEQVAAYNQGVFIKYLGDYFTFRKGRKTFVCFHYPISVWDGMGRGSMLLCGHSHGHFQLSRPEDTTHKILDCGWDIHKKPISLAEVETIMNSKGTNNLHHA